MKVTQLLKEDDAVSPVIGVILMVAITVILAAVIASFVLGLGGNQQKTPTASFSWDFENPNPGTNDKGIATVSHDGGDSIKADELVFRGEQFEGSASPPTIDSQSTDISQSGDTWPAGEATGSIGSASAVVGGNTVDIAVINDYDISLVWEPEEGSTSATLSEDTGPDA